MKSVGASLGLIGENVSGSELEYTSAERKEAIDMLEGTLALQQQKLAALRLFDNLASSPPSASDSRTQLAESCRLASLAWFNVIQQLPDSRNKSILLAAKVMHFYGLGAGHLYQFITNNKAAQRPNDLGICEKFLEMQVYTCMLCMQVGKNSVFQDRNRLTETVCKTMLEEFGAEQTARSFLKAFQLSTNEQFPPEIASVFYKLALDCIKQFFYQSDNPSDELIRLYRNDMYARLEAAVVSENKTAELKVRAEIEQMQARDQELYGNRNTTSYAGKQEQPKPHPTLRRRNKPTF